jgi:hypothetical protein
MLPYLAYAKNQGLKVCVSWFCSCSSAGQARSHDLPFLLLLIDIWPLGAEVKGKGHDTLCGCWVTWAGSGEGAAYCVAVISLEVSVRELEATHCARPGYCPI